MRVKDKEQDRGGRESDAPCIAPGSCNVSGAYTSLSRTTSS